MSEKNNTEKLTDSCIQKPVKIHKFVEEVKNQIEASKIGSIRNRISDAPQINEVEQDHIRNRNINLCGRYFFYH